MKKTSSKTNWKHLDKKDDSNINFSDISETDASFWDKAEVVMPSKKKSISIRLDEDVVKYFKEQGAGYQSRINAVLKSYMEHSH